MWKGGSEQQLTTPDPRDPLDRRMSALGRLPREVRVRCNSKKMARAASGPFWEDPGSVFGGRGSRRVGTSCGGARLESAWLGPREMAF